MRLDNKVAVLSHIDMDAGRVVARAFAAAGANVAGPCSAAKSQQTVAQIEEAAAKCVLVDGRPTNPDDVQRLVEATVERFGRMDVLVNAGSTHGGSSRPSLTSRTRALRPFARAATQSTSSAIRR